MNMPKPSSAVVVDHGMGPAPSMRAQQAMLDKLMVNRENVCHEKLSMLCFSGLTSLLCVFCLLPQKGLVEEFW